MKQRSLYTLESLIIFKLRHETKIRVHTDPHSERDPFFGTLDETVEWPTNNLGAIGRINLSCEIYATSSD